MVVHVIFGHYWPPRSCNADQVIGGGVGTRNLSALKIPFFFSRLRDLSETPYTRTNRLPAKLGFPVFHAESLLRIGPSLHLCRVSGTRTREISCG